MCMCLPARKDWTIMGPHGVNRAVQRLEFCDCKKGLGVKVIGGHRELTGEEFGIYVKRVIAGGLAAQDACDSERRVSEVTAVDDVVSVLLPDRAVDILRTASLSNHMSLLIARDDESRREFAELMEKYGSNNVTASGRISPTLLSTGKLTDASSSSSSRSESPQLLSPKEGVAGHAPPCPASSPYTAHAFSDSVIQLICVAKGTGLGLIVKGGAHRAEGPMVFIQEVVPGGDCQKDGRLQVGDQLVSVNKESLIGVTYEEARSVLTRTKLRPDPTVEIAFIRRRSSSSSSSGPHSPGSLPGSGGGGGPQTRAPGPPQPALVTKITSSPNPASEMLPAVSMSQVRVSPVRSEQTQSDVAPETNTGSSSSSPRLPEQFVLIISSCDLTVVDLTSLSSEPSRVSLCVSRANRLSAPGAAQEGLAGRRLSPQTGEDGADFQSLIRELFRPQLEELSITRPGSRFTSDDLSSVLESPSNLWSPCLIINWSRLPSAIDLDAATPSVQNDSPQRRRGRSVSEQ
ncbi:hypothetical protein F2P81_022821 [Scophthalmus maximus]|uniref:PDZ domain-containing protein n=1 Tax=Scophthalmus maximus TaxID=52904 RepID=A0A6A4S2Q1_SCOMX|nr:hypothetical protein F2P81_022821 [Scophthalmus maximus]